MSCSISLTCVFTLALETFSIQWFLVYPLRERNSLQWFKGSWLVSTIRRYKINFWFVSYPCLEYIDYKLKMRVHLYIYVIQVYNRSLNTSHHSLSPQTPSHVEKSLEQTQSQKASGCIETIHALYWWPHTSGILIQLQLLISMSQIQLQENTFYPSV